MKRYPKAVKDCKTAKGAQHTIQHIEDRIAMARWLGWVALEQAWQLALKVAKADARGKGFR